ncbi:MAG: Fe-S cluster assembly protein SufD, partial [Pseudomonadota bacterium]|nr:Fe-S cluster assembly protein SufD [Pseudomonadota bacterium]
MSDTQTFLDTLATRSQQRAGEPTWIAARRQAGAARFEAMGFPTRRDEEWKYTDVRAIAQGNFALAENAEFSQAQAAALTLPLDAYRLTFVDGVFSAALSDLDALPDSVQVMPLSKALTDNHEAV